MVVSTGLPRPLLPEGHDITIKLTANPKSDFTSIVNTEEAYQFYKGILTGQLECTPDVLKTNFRLAPHWPEVVGVVSALNNRWLDFKKANDKTREFVFSKTLAFHVDMKRKEGLWLL